MAAITDLATLTAIASGDWLVVNDVSAGTDKKITQADLLGGSGTWTPALRFGSATTGITYSALNASYVRIGTSVFISADIRLSSKGSATGNADIGGLPFSAAGANYNTPIQIRWVSMTTALVTMSGIIAASSAVVALYGLASANATLGTLTDAAFSNTSILQLAGWYITT